MQEGPVINITFFSEKIRKLEADANVAAETLLRKRDEIIASIPNFWVETINNYPIMSVILSEEDLEILDYLTVVKANINSEEAEIKLIFEPNPYFCNQVLSKKYTIDPEAEIFKSAISTAIDWKV